MAPRLAEETIAPEEAVLTQSFITFLREASASRAKQASRPIRRFNQARAAGCVEAQLEVPAGLPEGLRVGLFAKPGTYRATVRFANASSDTDKDRDIRGMSVKVHDVAGENLTPGVTEQDFVLNSHPVMMAGTTREFLELLSANEAGGARRILYFLSHLKAAGIARAAQQLHSCHLDIPYWSATPYLFGEGRAVKYRMQPTSAETSPTPVHPTDTYLTDRLRERLHAGGATFDLGVQFQTDAEKMPIEDASVEWASPFEVVATLRIPKQAVDSADRSGRCEAMRFNPWHALTAHRPLGGMNRARRAIYVALADFRGRSTSATR